MYHYCPEGTDLPIPCENGKTTTSERSADISDCVPCARGYFCRFADYFGSMTFDPTKVAAAAQVLTAFGKCRAGYVCTGGSYTSEPNIEAIGYICPAGAFCEEGALVETKCPAGTF